MQKRGLASPDDGDTLALTLAHGVTPVLPEDSDDDEEDLGGGDRFHFGGDGWMR